MKSSTMLRLSVSAAAVALSTGALADTLSNGAGNAFTNSLFLGGGTQTAPRLLAFVKCYAGVTASSTCSGAGLLIPSQYIGTSTYQYTVVGLGSGNGLNALVNEDPIGDGSSLTGFSGGNSGTTVTGATLTAASSLGKWDLTDSDAPLDTPDFINTAQAGATFLSGYTAGAYPVTPSLRGNLWQLPLAAASVQFAYNLPLASPGTLTATGTTSSTVGAAYAYPKVTTTVTAVGANPVATTYPAIVSGGVTYPAPNFAYTPSAADGETTTLRLSTDAICYIYTGLDHTGSAIGATSVAAPNAFVGAEDILSSGVHYANAHDWDNWAFTKANNKKPLFVPIASTPDNGVTFNYATNVQVASDGQTGGNTIITGAPAITALARKDDSGTNYILTVFLNGNCLGFQAANVATYPVGVPGAGTTVSFDSNGNPTNWWTAPSAYTIHPSFIQTATGNGGGGVTSTAGILNDAFATFGAVAYVGPGLHNSLPQDTSDAVTFVASTGLETNPAPLPTGYVQNAFTTVTGAQFVSPTTAAVQAAIAFEAPPAYITNTAGRLKGYTGIAAKNWGTTFNKKFFTKKVSGAYSVVGLTYLMGYQCYASDATNDRFQAVSQLLQAIYPDVAGAAGAMDGVLYANGLIPMSKDQQTNGKSKVINQAAYELLFDGLQLDVTGQSPGTTHNNLTALQQVSSTATYGTGAKPLQGPWFCSQAQTDQHL